jgi:hypothetical protein
MTKFLTCPSYRLFKERECTFPSSTIHNLDESHSTCAGLGPNQDDTWEWQKSHKMIPTWAVPLIPENFCGSDFIGQVYQCSFGRSKSQSRKHETPACPWSRLVLFKSSGSFFLLFLSSSPFHFISFLITYHLSFRLFWQQNSFLLKRSVDVISRKRCGWKNVL